MNQSHATLDALLDHLFEKLLLHVPLRSPDGRARAEHAIRLAMIGGLDPNRFWERLSQHGHRIGDDIRSHRAYGTDQRMTQCRHFAPP
jgi:hypothetical protein